VKYLAALGRAMVGGGRPSADSAPADAPAEKAA